MARTSARRSPLASMARQLLDNRGSVALIFGLTVPLIVAAAGVGVETSYWYLNDLKLQSAADAAAYAAAIEKRSGSDYTAVKAAATDVATGNGFDTSTGTITVNAPPTSGPNQTTLAVEVLLQQPVQRFFTAVFFAGTVAESARAVAVFKASGNACILALNPTASKSVLFSGNTGVNVKGCDVMSNSIAVDAIKTQGSSITKAGCFISTGGIDTSGGTVTLDCAASVKNAPPVGDPFAGIAAPTASGSCLNENNNATPAPGHYCHGMTLKDNVTLSPGVYYVSGGDFQVNANAVVKGDGVTIYLSGDARISMNGNSTTQLSAPTSGTYSGILFFGDRASTSGTNNTFNGTNDSLLTGYIYTPTAPVNYLGNFSGNKGCTRIVASTVQWSGNTTVDDTQDCSALGLKKTPVSELVTLSE